MSSLRRVALPGLFLSVGVAALALAAPSALSFQAAGDVTLRGGAYAAINDNGGLLVTRASSTPDYVRRALLDFDTTSIPAGVSITAATLTLTVHWGGTSALRDVAVYDVTTPFVESEATWDTASASRAWTTRGGDLGHEYARSAVPNAAGAKARFAVTSLVQAAVDAAGSAHTRVALVDVDSLSDARDGYRDYFSREAVDPAVRPLLKVTYSTTPPPPVPAFSNVFTILMENHEYSSIIGSANAPYINRLAAQYGLATNYTGVAHPSLPNYMALTGGRPVFTTDCIGCTTPARNVVDEVYDSGRTWKAYMESMPTACATTDTSLYVQKHNPFVHYDDIVKDRTRCVHHVVPFTQFDTVVRLDHTEHVQRHAQLPGRDRRHVAVQRRAEDHQLAGVCPLGDLHPVGRGDHDHRRRRPDSRAGHLALDAGGLPLGRCGGSLRSAEDDRRCVGAGAARPDGVGHGVEGVLSWALELFRFSVVAILRVFSSRSHEGHEAHDGFLAKGIRDLRVPS
jgi:hypothetical protein